MDDRRGAMRDVVDSFAGWALAVEFGKKRHHAAADRGSRKSSFCSPVIILQGRQIRPSVTGLVALEVGVGTDHDGLGKCPGLAQDGGCVLQFSGWLAGWRYDQP